MKKQFKKGVSLLLAMMTVASGVPSMTSVHGEGSPKVLISELCDPKANYQQERFVELYNASNQSVSLEGWKLEIIENTEAKRSFELTGTLDSGKVIVLGIEGYSSANQTLAGEWTSFNGKGGDGAKLYDPAGTLIDDAGTALASSDCVFTRNPNIGTPNGSYSASEWTKKNCASVAEATPGRHVSDYPMSDTQVGEVRSNTTEGTVPAGTEIVLECGTSGAQIMYAITKEDSEPTDFETYSGPVKVDSDMYLWAKGSKEGMEDSEIYKFKYTVLAHKTILDVREKVNDKAIVEGIVTARMGQYDVYIQDDTAGMIASQYKSGAFPGNVGDLIRVEGTIASFYENAQIQPDAPSNVTVVEEGHGVPDAMNISPAELTNAVEGMLVMLTDVTVTASDTKGTYTVTDSNSKTGKVKATEGQLTVGKKYESISGVVNYHFNEHKVLIRTMDDIVEDSTKVLAPGFSLPGGTVESGTHITLSTKTEGASIYFEVGADEASTATPTASSAMYISPIAINESNLVIKAVAIKEGMQDSDVVRASFTIGDVLRIHDIQGATHTSPKAGESVANIKGIVTGVSNDKYIKGFFIQEPDVTTDTDPKTSEGIFISTSYTGIKVGDLVSVKGTVEEVKNDTWNATLKETQIKASRVDVLANNQKMPSAVVIGEGGRAIPNAIIDNDQFKVFDPEEDGIDYYESLEGMLVQINEPAIVGCDERYGEVYVLADDGIASKHKRTANGGIIISSEYANPELLTLDDVLKPITNPSTKAFFDKTFMPKPGDTFNSEIKGIVTYGFGKYKIYNTEALPSIKDGGLKREVTGIVKEDDKLTVASYNIENFDPGDGQEKADKIAESITTNLKLPDIIALIEVQDNDGPVNSDVVKADASYQFLIDAIKEKSRTLTGSEVVYKFTDIPPIDDTEGGEPGGNIRVGYIYRQDRVSLINENQGASDEAVSIVGGHLSKNPGRIDPLNSNFKDTRKSLAAEFNFNGESVFIIANHFSSKGGDEPDFGENQPPVKGSEPKRHEQAKVINGFVDTLFESNPKANVIVLGDMNDYQFSETLHLLEGKGTENVLTNLMEEIPFNQQYSYNYGGNSQVLDNVLVSNHLVSSIICDPVNINSEFVEAAGRCSDHDPLLIQIGFKGGGSGQTLAEAKDLPAGSEVTVTGIVLNEPGIYGQKNIYIQDETTGVLLTTKTLDGAIHQGSKVKAVGTTSQYSGQFQIQIKTIELVDDEIHQVTPQVITGTELNEAMESELITLKNAVILAMEKDPFDAAYLSIKVDGKIIEAKLDSRSGAGYKQLSRKFTVGDRADVTGIVFEFNGVYRLSLRSVDDMVASQATESKLKISDLYLTDLNKKELSTFKKGETALVYTTVENLDQGKTTGVVMVEIIKGNKKVVKSMYEADAIFEADNPKIYKFKLKLKGLSSGKHTVIVRLYDSLKSKNELCKPVSKEISIQ